MPASFMADHTATEPLIESANGWYWDKFYRKYWRYRVNVSGQYDRDADGHHIRVWQTEDQTVPVSGERENGSPLVESRSHTIDKRRDSKSGYDPNMAPAAPDDVKDKLVFRGTPEDGWYETLDQSYRMRTRTEERSFFKPGRVFAMLWSETASGTTKTGTENSKHTSIYPGRYREGVYCSIRRFVVVRVSIKQHYVEACAITTYGKRGTLKPGCNPSEHTIVYLEGHTPMIIAGELEAGMTKGPIAIRPTDPNEKMEYQSRLRLGKIYSIECNVKVRDIGMIVDRTTFLRYHQEVRNDEFESEDLDMQTPRPTPAHLNATNGYNTQAYLAPPSQAYGYTVQQHPCTYQNVMPSQGLSYINGYPQAPAYAQPENQTYDERLAYSGYTNVARTGSSYGGGEGAEDQPPPQVHAQFHQYPHSSSSSSQPNGHAAYHSTYSTNTYPYPPGI